MLGSKLSHYRVIEKLGAGAMGEVYRAIDERLERDVAIKVLRAGTLADEPKRRQFHREAISLSRLNHPRIAHIYDFGNQDGNDYLVMELVQGTTLAQRLATGLLEPNYILRVGAQLAEALEEAHDRGVIHRDLKPSNIGVTDKGHVKILDFGVAKLLQPGSSRVQSLQPFEEAGMRATIALHETGIVGTLHYMSPEQLRAEEVDHSTDTWALGVVLYEMACGRLPFRGQNTMELAEQIQHRQPAPLRTINPLAMAELERVILRCLEKNKSRRYAKTGDVGNDLNLLLGGTTPAIEIVSPRSNRIAILPLENLSGSADQEYFVDGMHEELMGTLARISSLLVISRSSVRQYKNTTKSLPEIARELDVGYIIEGSVRTAGDSVLISVQLVDATDDRYVWGESYERELKKVLAMQRDVAQAVAREIKVKLAPREQEQLEQLGTVNPEAYNAYLRGRFYLNRVTLDSLCKAIEHFEMALRMDPLQARSFAGIADCHVLLADSAIGPHPPLDTLSRAAVAAQKALELDSSLAEAHASLALVSWRLSWDWEKAEREFQQAVLLNPNYPTAHQWYGWFLGACGRMPEAVAEIKEALRLDPLSLWINSSLGLAYYFSRRYDDAINQLRETLELDPNFVVAHLPLGWSYLQKGMHAEAFAELERGAELSRRSPTFLSALGHAYAVGGRTEEAEQMLAELLDLSKNRYVPSDQFARIQAALGRNDEALALLERAAEEHSSYIAYLEIDPKSDPLRAHPRFNRLMRLINYPDLVEKIPLATVELQ